MLSHIRRGSNCMDAIIVSTTTDAERERARSGRDDGERLEAHQRDGERDDENIEHRPAADALDHAIERRALRAAASASALHRPT